jgi:hypothetical protein
MVRDESSANGQNAELESGTPQAPHHAHPRAPETPLGTGNLTQELAQLLAATIAHNQAQRGATGGVPTGADLASLASLMTAASQHRSMSPAFKDGLSALSYNHSHGGHSQVGAVELRDPHHHDDEPMPIPSTWRQPVNSDDERWYRQQVGAAALGLLAGLIVVVPSVLWLSGWLGGPQTKAGRQPVADQSTSIKVADVKTVRVVPIEKTENASQYVAASVDPRQTAVGPQPSAVEKPPVVVPAPPPAAVLAPPPPPKVVEPPRPRIEDLVAEAKQRISMGDMAGARSVLANAQDLAPGPIAFALAETYDPNMLASWQTRGVPAEPEKAKALYMRAREFGDSRAQQRIDWLLGR